MKLSRLTMLTACALLWPLLAGARLPDPTPEDRARQQAAAEKKARDEDAAKAALARAQERVVRRYRATHPGAPKPVLVVAPAGK